MTSRKEVIERWERYKASMAEAEFTTLDEEAELIAAAAIQPLSPVLPDDSDINIMLSRLRDDLCGENDGCNTFKVCACCTMLEAADLIERLQSQVGERDALVRDLWHQVPRRVMTEVGTFDFADVWLDDHPEHRALLDSIVGKGE